MKMLIKRISWTLALGAALITFSQCGDKKKNSKQVAGQSTLSSLVPADWDPTTDWSGSDLKIEDLP